MSPLLVFLLDLAAKMVLTATIVVIISVVVERSGPYITVSEMNFTGGPGHTDNRTLIPASSVRYILAP